MMDDTLIPQMLCLDSLSMDTKSIAEKINDLANFYWTFSSFRMKIALKSHRGKLKIPKKIQFMWQASHPWEG